MSSAAIRSTQYSRNTLDECEFIGTVDAGQVANCSLWIAKWLATVPCRVEIRWQRGVIFGVETTAVVIKPAVGTICDMSVTRQQHEDWGHSPHIRLDDLRKFLTDDNEYCAIISSGGPSCFHWWRQAKSEADNMTTCFWSNRSLSTFSCFFFFRYKSYYQPACVV